LHQIILGQTRRRLALTMRWRVLAIVTVMAVDLPVVRPSRVVLRPRAMNRIAKAIKREQLMPPSVSLIMLGPTVIPTVFVFVPGWIVVICDDKVVKTMMLVIAAIVVMVVVMAVVVVVLMTLVKLPRMRVVLV
jgi:hypothetical protein